MKKVYAVSSGSYSDYGIDAIFSTKEKAEEFMQFIKNDDYNKIEEYEIDPPEVDRIKHGYSIWHIVMLQDGSVEKIEKKETDTYHVTNIGHFIWKRTEIPYWAEQGLPDALQSTVWAKTEKQAIKIVNEHRAQLIAMNKF